MGRGGGHFLHCGKKLYISQEWREQRRVERVDKWRVDDFCKIDRKSLMEDIS
jgi:hypothetical protein